MKYNSDKIMPDKKIFFSSCQANQMDLYKEAGEIPYYFSKLFGYNSIINEYYDETNPSLSMFRSVCLQKYGHRKYFIRFRRVLNVFIHAKNIDILFLLTICPDSMFKMLFYRLGGGKGKIYLKLDLGLYAKDGKDLLIWKNMNFILKIVHMLFKPLPNLYTVETKRAYERLEKTYYSDCIDMGKLYRMPNGFDSEILDECGIIPKSISEKEKIIITVGKIGTAVKNTEFLLDILASVDLKDWKVYIIGPIVPEFSPKIDKFYADNPEKRYQVLFTGAIYSRKELYDYYNRSRVFMLTSLSESYGYVLTEAAYMNNYLISRDVGIAKELLEYTNGFVIDTTDKEPFVNELQRIINLSDNELNVLVSETNKEELTWEWILLHNQGIEKLVS